MNEEIINEEVIPVLAAPKPTETKIDITDEEKENFFKAMLADKPYTQVVPLFDNRITVKFTTLSMATNDHVLRQINSDQEKGIANNDNRYFTVIAQYRLALSIESINSIPFQPEITESTFPFNKDTGQSYVTERIKAFAAMQTPKIAGLLSGFRTFEGKVLKMTNMMEDPTFWKAAV